jgi:hypothetical protein
VTRGPRTTKPGAGVATAVKPSAKAPKGGAASSRKPASASAKAPTPTLPPKPKSKPKSKPTPTPTPKRARRLGLVAIAGAGIVAAVVLYIVHATRSEPARKAPQASASEAPKRVPGLTPPTAAELAGAPDGYVGAGRCRDCHEPEYKAWAKDWHAKALAPATGANVVGNFNGAHFAGTSSEATMSRKGGAPVMTTRDADGNLAEFPVDRVIGGKRMQDSVTILPDGRWQVLPVYFHVTTHEWVDYTETKQGALTPESSFYWTNVRRMANHECLDCHTTAVRVSYDEATHAWTTGAADPSVACEDCHGPGARHAESQDAHDILHPARAKAAGYAACARCHAPRNPLWPLLDASHRYKIGDDYDEFYDPVTVGASSDFFADGRPSTSSFEYTALVQSKCARSGGATCLTCHVAPHDAHRPNELRAELDVPCRECHAAEAKAGAKHSHHARATCVSCHMPPVVSGVLDHFADHAIDIPAPVNTVRHGVPSACGVCHADKTPAEQLAMFAATWPDAKTQRRETLADAFDEATASSSRPALETVLGDATEAPTLRGAAALALGRRFGRAATGSLLPLLADPSLVLRAKGCEALGLAKDRSAADPIAARFLGDKSLRVRLACALALWDLHDPRGEQSLVTLATTPATSHLMIPHFELGEALARRGDFTDAKRELTWVARLSPYYVDGLVALAGVAAETGDFTEANARVAQALALSPHDRAALALAAKLKRHP